VPVNFNEINLVQLFVSYWYNYYTKYPKNSSLWIYGNVKIKLFNVPFYSLLLMRSLTLSWRSKKEPKRTWLKKLTPAALSLKQFSAEKEFQFNASRPFLHFHTL
jgi:hypothetical protein